MRLLLLFTILLNSLLPASGQSSLQRVWIDDLAASGQHITNIIGSNQLDSLSAEFMMEKIIAAADQSFSLDELTAVVKICSKYCNKSKSISLLLTDWLRENNSINTNRSPIEAGQFRGYLLAALQQFPPNKELYRCIKYEFVFNGHAFNIAAAALAARNFPDSSVELIPLMEPYLSGLFVDEWVDVTTPKLNYPIANPTKARYEIIKTLVEFGPLAYRSVKLLDEIADVKNSGLFGADSVLGYRSLSAAKYIRKVTPPCCQKEDNAIAVTKVIHLIAKSDRKQISTTGLQLMDQEGMSVKFDDLRNKPFVLTFFYTQCTNDQKCVATVKRLGDLERECIQSNLQKTVGIYGMTYDPDFDSQSILKKYGNLYGFLFDKQMKFLRTTNDFSSISDQLGLRVNYGAGTVNQHGIQLFVFDKKGRVAAIFDNELWSAKEVKDCLVRLINE